jgi:serine/threonine protein kinase/tetratricopeptide (TPR) repeat protein
MGSDQMERLKRALAGRYHFDRELGHGAFASVHVARDLRHERLVAIKVLHVESGSELNEIRFLQEIRFLASLQHPNIVPVHDSGHVEDLLYYVMPYVRGETVRERIQRERQLAISQAARISCEIADALDYAHRQGVIHRDIKPENILLSGSHAMLADFGIARAIDSARTSHITRTGLGSPGTPAYMSPEQLIGGHPLDNRTDIYSLGCVLFEMITGKPPFEGPSGFASRFDEHPPSLCAMRGEIAPALDAVVMKALARNPAERYSTGSEMCDALSDALARGSALPSGVSAQPTLGRPFPPITPAAQSSLPKAGDAPVEPNRRPGRHYHRIAWATAGLLVLALGGVVAAALRPRSPTASPPDPRRIAVLEFEDQSSAHDLGYLASGLTVSLTHELSGVSAIEVLSRNSVRAFRERALSLDSLIAALRVGSLVEGSVQRSNDRLRVTVQVVDAVSKTQLSSATIERKTGELFMLEDDLARQVASLLRRRLGVELRLRETIAGTRSARARDLVFQADKIRDDVSATAAATDGLDLPTALTSLRRADSLLAAAESADQRWNMPLINRGWVALEVAQRITGGDRLLAYENATQQAARVLSRDPANADALELRGTAYYRQAARLNLSPAKFEDRLARAEEDLQNALSTDSLLPNAWGILSLVRVARGDVSQAERDAETALGMDTYLQEAPTILGALYAANLMKGNASDARQWCNRGASDYPKDPRFLDCQLTLLAEDRSLVPDPRLAWRLAARAEDLDPPLHARATGREFLPIYRQLMVAIILARTGQADSARAVARRARADVSKGSDLDMDVRYEEAFLRLTLGEREAATSMLAEYLGARPSLRGLVARHPRWKPLWNDPTFIALVAVPRSFGK